jgi:hypothetical protein
MPENRTAKPIPNITNPFMVHSGLPYIKDDCGPTSDLVCAIKTNPAVIDSTPITINILLRCLIIPTYNLPCIFHFR